jgi:hypothetical protein
MKGRIGILAILIFAGCSNDPVVPSAHKDTVASKDSTPLQNLAVNQLSPVDVSPMDISYFPSDFPVSKMSGTNSSALPLARVIYSRPHRQGRKIFGNLLKYGEPWRMGANEATEIEFFSPATIQGKNISKGRYVLYCIPQPTQWTIVLNSNTYSWGLKPDPKKDLYRFVVPATTMEPPLEYCTIVFEKNSTGADLVMAWDNVMARLPISFKP